jgi:hypothetical protein
MAMKESGGKQFPIPDEGIVPGRLARVIEIGEHETGYGVKDQVFLHFNLPTRLIDDEDSDFHGKQFMVRTAPLRNSTSEKAALYKYRSVLKPNTTDYNELLGKACFLTLTHNEVEKEGNTRTYCNITNVSGVPEGMEVGMGDTDTFYFDFDSPDADLWEELGEWTQDKIKSALNYPGSEVEKMVLHLEAMTGE